MKKLNIFQDFILNNYNQEEKETYDMPESKIENYFSICGYIYDSFYQEYIVGNSEVKTKSKSDLFYEWCSGLPGILDTFDIFVYDNKKYYDESGY